MPPLYSHIVDYIMEKINSGQWQEGDMVPREIDLCQQFQVSRPTVRTALQVLVNKGLLVRTKGKGTFVSQPKTLENSTIFIESFAEEMKSRGVETKTELLEFRLLPAEERIAEKLKLEAGDTVFKLTRLRYAEGCFETGPVVLTSSYFLPEVAKMAQGSDLEHVSMRKILKNHRLERKFIEKVIDILLLDGKECRLLGAVRHAPAFLISSTTKDQNGRLFEYCESIYPADRNKFMLKLRM